MMQYDTYTCIYVPKHTYTSIYVPNHTYTYQNIHIRVYMYQNINMYQNIPLCAHASKQLTKNWMSSHFLGDQCEVAGEKAGYR
jgi:hypothetical protein